MKKNKIIKKKNYKNKLQQIINKKLNSVFKKIMKKVL